jgi:hypothetical protein
MEELIDTSHGQEQLLSLGEGLLGLRRIRIDCLQTEKRVDEGDVILDPVMDLVEKQL